MIADLQTDYRGFAIIRHIAMTDNEARNEINHKWGDIEIDNEYYKAVDILEELDYDHYKDLMERLTNKHFTVKKEKADTPPNFIGATFESLNEAKNAIDKYLKKFQSYTAHGQTIRIDMIRALQDYVERGTRPGGFLYTLLCNDLVEAVRKADKDNIEAIPAYASYLYNEMPGNSWGNREAVEKWIEQGGAEEYKVKTYDY